MQLEVPVFTNIGQAFESLKCANNITSYPLLDKLLLGGTLSLTPKEVIKLKEQMRKNIPMSRRADVWLMLSGGCDVLEVTPTLYRDACHELFSKSPFLCNTSIPNSHYLTPKGCNMVQKIVYVIRHLNPDITYCPLLERFATIMLHFIDEEKVFACLSGMLSKNMIDETKTQNIASDATVQDILRHTDKKVFCRLESFVTSHAEAKGYKLVVLPLIRVALFDRLPFDILVRIIDCYLIEGDKLFYRAGLYLLNLFYIYSLSFQKLFCSSPHDLVTTIGQYIQSLKLEPDSFIKHILKINISSKQINKMKEANLSMLQKNMVDYTEEICTPQIVAVDMNKVSDIIKPDEWQQVCEWLPARLQVKQPFLLFTTNDDGYNLKTLYLKCEDEEQTLLLVKTTQGEVFGAYISQSLIERHNGHQNLSYFGTGETFVFKLSPTTDCYRWNVVQVKNKTTRPSMSKYVFVETQQRHIRDEDTEDKPKRSRKKSLKRNISKRLSRRSTKRPGSLLPLTASVPNKLFEGNVTDNSVECLPVKPFKSAVNFNKLTDDGHKESLVMKDLPHQAKLPRLESFDVIDAHDGGNTSKEHEDHVCMENIEEGPIDPFTDLFVSCDNSQLGIGGGGGQAIFIDGEMHKGRSTTCTTFHNSPLASDGDFIVARVDVFGFQ